MQNTLKNDIRNFNSLLIQLRISYSFCCVQGGRVANIERTHILEVLLLCVAYINVVGDATHFMLWKFKLYI